MFISHKERDNYELRLKLQYKRIITTPKDIFENQT